MKPKTELTRRQSTRAFYRRAKDVPQYSLFDRLHAYVYLRWPYLYIGVGKVDHPLVRYFAAIWKVITRFLLKADRDDPERVSFADTYHGKVVPTAATAQLVSIQEDIRIDDLEQVIPYAKARSIVMENPNHIIALECPCRSVKADPCLAPGRMPDCRGALRRLRRCAPP